MAAVLPEELRAGGRLRLRGWVDVVFADRVDAGRRLAERLGHLRDQNVVVLGLPRGGVPVAAEVAGALHAPLDVILVRKIGVPFHPELAMGAIGEGDVRIVNDDVIHVAQVTTTQFHAVEVRERAELERRAGRVVSRQSPPDFAAGSYGSGGG